MSNRYITLNGYLIDVSSVCHVEPTRGSEGSGWFTFYIGEKSVRLGDEFRSPLIEAMQECAANENSKNRG